MYSSTPSRPITSSRGAADTTAGRIYFSIPSAQVRVPVGDLVFFDPHLCSHYTTRGKVIRERQRKGAAGVREKGGAIIIPGGRRWPKIRKKIRKLSNSAENTLFHTFIHWAELDRIFIHWAELYPILRHWAELSPMLIHWAELYPILIHWAEHTLS